ncbi:MAG: hypothetical protein ABSE08_19730 [Syntrophobacteraceae bacterium]
MVSRALGFIWNSFRTGPVLKMRFGCMAHNLVRYCGLFGAVALLGAGLGLPERAVAGSLYDQPLEIRHVGLKPDPLNPQAKRDVSCFTYPNFVVKQVDFGEVDADRLSIIPAASGKTTPCRQAKERNEYVIPSESWSGHFGGVKSDYAFFDASDGTNGGLGFMVFRVSDRKKLFEDSAEKGFESIEIKDGTLKLRYQRVFTSGCSVVTGGPACRDIIAKQAGVAGESLSSCANGYQVAKEEMARMRCSYQSAGDGACFDKELKHINEQKWDDAPTVIVYEVEVGLGGASPVIKPLSDALACRPAD